MPNAKSNSSLRNTKSTRAPESQGPSSDDAQEGSSRTGTEQDPRNQKLSVGGLLTEARERAGLSQSEVAAQMNVLVETIRALENDDLRSLPEPPHIHDYLHMYARIVKISPKNLRRMFDKQYSNEFGYYSRSRRRAGHRSRVLWKIAILLVLLVGLYAAWQGYKKLQEVYLAENQVPEAESELPADISEHFGDVAPAAVHTGVPDSQGMPSPVADDIPSHGSEHVDQADPATGLAEGSHGATGDAGVLGVVQAAEGGMAEDTTQSSLGPSYPEEAMGNAAVERHDEYPANELTAETLASGSEDALQTGQESFLLTFLEECWVEVKDADLRLLVQDLFQEGGTLKVQGKAPFQVILGNSPGVLLEVNGKQFDHSRFVRRKQVAIFRLSGSLFE
ncbi:MAG: DUF4115 domain-containing protein [Gammaproteobacteria bacterium]|nr:DUF4115 domain-containing protein [Gammaproteobacteria bacterium]